MEFYNTHSKGSNVWRESMCGRHERVGGEHEGVREGVWGYVRVCEEGSEGTKSPQEQICDKTTSRPSVSTKNKTKHKKTEDLVLAPMRRAIMLSVFFLPPFCSVAGSLDFSS